MTYKELNTGVSGFVAGVTMCLALDGAYVYAAITASLVVINILLRVFSGGQ